MRKPPESYSLSIQVPDEWPAEKKAQYIQATTQRFLKEREQEKRDYEMFRKGQASARGILGIFGL